MSNQGGDGDASGSGTIVLEEGEVELADAELADLKAMFSGAKPAATTPAVAPPPPPPAQPVNPVHASTMMDEDDGDLAALKAQFSAPAAVPAPVAPAPAPAPAPKAPAAFTATLMADDDDDDLAALKAQFSAPAAVVAPGPVLAPNPAPAPAPVLPPVAVASPAPVVAPVPAKKPIELPPEGVTYYGEEEEDLTPAIANRAEAVAPVGFAQTAYVRERKDIELPVRRAPTLRPPPAAAAPPPDPWHAISARSKEDNVLAKAVGRPKGAEDLARTAVDNARVQPALVTFHSEAFDLGDWSVRSMKARDAVSQLYVYELEIEAWFHEALDEAQITQLLQAGATVAFGENREQPVHGIVSEAELLTDEASTTVVYRVVFVPRLWLLTQTTRSRVFQDKSIPDIVKAVLKGAGMDAPKEPMYEFRLGRTYEAREYVVQYQETDFDFVSRWLEHQGIFYAFEHGDNVEKVVFYDDVSHVSADVLIEPLPYYTTQGRMDGVDPVTSLRRVQRRIPREVTLQDFNWRTPSQSLATAEEIVPDGFGTQMLYGEHYKTIAEGKQLAKLRAAEHAARQTVYQGRSRVRALHAGMRFTLEGHFSEGFNREYFVLEVRHQCAQGNFSQTDQSAGTEGYTNEFVAIASDALYAPPRRTPWPRLHGLVHGRVDGHDDGLNAPLDSKGRYRIALPWAQAEKSGLNVSRWIRRAQPSAGGQYGTHLPIHVGTEVLIAHVEGDPDRPVIVGAVPNEETASPVTQTNAATSAIRTRARIVIQMTDG